MSLYVFAQTSALLNALSDELEKLSEEKREIHIALSGGSTPKHWFEYLAASCYRERIAWEHLHFWWGDERCVPSESPDSNFGEAHRLLFDKIDLATEHVHPMYQSDPDHDLKNYTNRLRDRLPLVNGQPQFDWVMLGVGEDGHTASLFPGQFDMETSAPVICVAHPENGQLRLSLSAKVIANARRVSFLVTGPRKSGILAQVLAPGAQDCSLPAAQVRSSEGITDWFVDQAAAADIQHMIPNA